MITDWHGLYREGWRQEIVPDAYAHPAKYSRGLIRKIYDHAIEQGYLSPGDTVLDPFGGVALGALDAMSRGCYWLGCELEERFVKLGHQNLEQWHNRYYLKWPNSWGAADLFQGDSRELCRVIYSHAEPRDGYWAIVSSPPWDAGAPPIAPERVRESSSPKDHGSAGPQYLALDHPANLGNLPPGDVAAVVSSPPFGAALTRHVHNSQPGEVASAMTRSYTQDNQGTTEGNLAGMDAVVSSPPYQTGGHHNHQLDAWNTNSRGQTGKQLSGYADESPGQLGGHGDTFWSAARTIVDQCHMVLKPGGYAIWVVKRFVRNKEIVDFPGQWEAMCQAAGFETVERIRAWLVEEKGLQLGMFGAHKQLKTERKSFFRRLYEKKYPENSIDWEDVIVMRKPC